MILPAVRLFRISLMPDLGDQCGRKLCQATVLSRKAVMHRCPALLKQGAVPAGTLVEAGQASAQVGWIARVCRHLCQSPRDLSQGLCPPAHTSHAEITRERNMELAWIALKAGSLHSWAFALESAVMGKGGCTPLGVVAAYLHGLMQCIFTQWGIIMEKLDCWSADIDKTIARDIGVSAVLAPGPESWAAVSGRCRLSSKPAPSLAFSIRPRPQSSSTPAPFLASHIEGGAGMLVQSAVMQRPLPCFGRPRAAGATSGARIDGKTGGTERRRESWGGSIATAAAAWGVGGGVSILWNV